MGAIEGFFKSVEKNRKKQVVFFCISMSLIICVFCIAIKIMNLNFKIVMDDFSWVYQIDLLEEEKDVVKIRGWAFALNENSKNKNFELILRNVETGKNVYAEMQYEPRADVNTYFFCEYDYTESGFVALFSKQHLNLSENVYEIILKPRGRVVAYSTNIYCAYGKLLFMNPNEFVPLDVEGTKLEKVISEGKLRTYNVKNGMYVYQYKGDLYWIVDKNYKFAEGSSYIQFQMETTQTDKLPKMHLDNNWLWNNLSFYFTEYELKDFAPEKYRVARYSLPTDMSITRIWTGEYNNDWIWRSDFRPWYEFE